MNLSELPDVFSVKELRQVMDLGVAASYALTHRKDFPTIKVNKTIRISKRGFEKWLEKQSQVN